MVKYKVTQRQTELPKPKWSVQRIVVGLLPGLIGLGLIGLGLLTIVSVHQGGHNSNSRAGLGFIVIGLVVLGVWAFSSGGKGGGYNF